MTEESVPMWQGVTVLQVDREYIVKYQLKGHRRLRLMFADYVGYDQYADIYLFHNNNDGKVYTLYVDDIYSIEEFAV
jgi:hypothetical protein